VQKIWLCIIICQRPMLPYMRRCIIQRFPKIKKE
jgi:hypothetical protein